MDLLLFGVSHRTAPMDVLERAAVDAEDAPGLLDELLGSESVAEALVLSTCNRVEVYALVESYHDGLADISGVLARHAGLDLTDHRFVHHSDAAVGHLFSVAAGLDSVAVGEAQIQGQLRTAYATARALGTVGSRLHPLIQRALHVGRRTQAETGIDAANVSLVSEALTDAAAALPGMEGRRALVVGAGGLAALTVAELCSRGVAELAVANRTAVKADRLAGTAAAKGVPARAVALDAVPDELSSADLVIACTGARDVVLTADAVATAGAPLVICDLAMPRDVDPSVRHLPGVTLIDLEGLADRLRQTEVGHDLETARELVADEVRRYLSEQRLAEITPMVATLRRHVTEVVDAELLRLGTRLPELPDDVQDELAHTMHRVVGKLLHTPTVRIKQLAEGPGWATYAEMLREVFALEAPPPPALVRP
jgi:glutamyl-tRNA reductase